MSQSQQEPRIIPIGGVMGNFPDALELAERVDAGAFAVPERLWRFLSNSGEQWTTISAFWRAIAKRKCIILLASNPGLVSASSSYGMELAYLRTLGFCADAIGTRLDFKSGLPQGAVVAHNPAQYSGGIFASFARKFLPRSTPGARAHRCLIPVGSDPKLEEAIRAELSFLFQKFSATVSSNHKYPATCGNAIAVVTTSTLTVRVVRDRDEFRIDVAPAHAPTEWKPLTSAAVAVTGDALNAAFDSYTGLPRGAKQLQDSWGLLSTAFSQEQFSATTNIIKQVEQTKRMEWVSRFNPPASGD